MLAPDTNTLSSSPHLVYYIEPWKLIEFGSLEEAQPIAWRMSHLTFSKRLSSEVDITQNPENTDVTSVTEGPFSDAPFSVIEQFSPDWTAMNIEAEVRILQIPEFRLFGVWLHSDQLDTVIPMAPTAKELEPLRNYTPSELAENLHPLFARLRDSSPDADS